MRKKLPATGTNLQPDKRQRHSSNGCSHAQGDRHVTTSDNTLRLLPPTTLLLCATAIGQIGAVRAAWAEPSTGSAHVFVGEVVVTARKIEQHNHTGPAPVTAIGADTTVNTHLPRL